ncbi:MAG: TetR/AcrR family transcriptional regulator [Lactobacillus sp.]|jgi:AcrR family transcriptional regulator|nr:TetR/AcrR family transcriptional regulator [Lactobacillus sp.]
MARPSTNLDKKMLEAGVKIIIKDGVNGLTARNICKEADVNLGMFNYYFKSKDYYITLLYSLIHKDIEDFINVASMDDKPSLVKLKQTLSRLNEYTKKNPELSEAMFADVFHRYNDYKRYMEEGIIPNFRLFIQLIAEAQKDGYLRKDWSVIEMFAFIFFGGLVPEMYSNHLDDILRLYKYKEAKSPTKSNFARRMDLIFNELESVDMHDFVEFSQIGTGS